MQLTLKHFIARQRVVDLYRSAIRASRVIPDPVARKETLSWIRVDFDRNKHLTDIEVIEDKISVVRKEIREILPTVKLPK